MRLLMPFWNLNLLHRYRPQLEALAAYLDEFHIIYLEGEPEGSYADFHRLRFRRYPASKFLNWSLNLPRAWRQVRNIDIDAYYCLSGFWFEIYSHYFSKRSGRPYAVRLRGDQVRVTELLVKNRLKRWVKNNLYRGTLLEADLVIPISEKLRLKAIKLGVSPSKLTQPIPNGVDTDLFKPEKFPSELTVGYAGRISREKGSIFLTALMEKTPDIKYLVAGPIEDSAFKPPKNCEYLGVLPYEKMPEFYNRCSLIVLPSYTEGFPNVLLEAYACGRPLMASPICFPDPEARSLSIPLKLDVRLWVSNLEWLRGHYEDMVDVDISERRRWAEKYSWPEFGRRIVEALRRLIR